VRMLMEWPSGGPKSIGVIRAVRPMAEKRSPRSSNEIEIYIRSYIRNDCKIDPKIRVHRPGISSETLTGFETIELKIIEEENRG
jgi:hypothetical protein